MAGIVMEQRRRKVPVFLRQAIRQGIGVCIAVSLGYYITGMFGGRQERIGMQWLQGCKWAAITIVVVAAPMLGKVTQVSVERTIGTVFGGLLGLATVLFGHGFGQDGDIVVTSLVAFAVAFGAVCVGWALSLDYSAKLFVMTFVLVVMGSERIADAYLVALTRIVGIVGGVMLMLLLSVIVFPKSASHQAADNMAEAMICLVNLSNLAWKATFAGDPLKDTRLRMERARSLGLKRQDGYAPLLQDEQQARRAAEKAVEQSEADCEKTLMEVYNKLVKCDELLPVAANEVYFKTFRGRWCFLPGIPFLNCISCLGRPSWRLPQREMRDLATCMRRVARVLWAIHVTFQEGFEEEVALVLQRKFPASLLAELQASSQAALVEMAQAFPYKPAAPALGLRRFEQVVAELIKTSEELRRTAVQQISRRSSGFSARPSSNNLSRYVSEANGFLAHPMSPASSEVLGSHANSPPPSVKDADCTMLTDMDPAASSMKASPRVEAHDRDDLDSIAEQIDMFPPTTAGYSSKVRWFCFQFLMQQLSQEINDMNTATQLVLAALPKPPKKSRQPLLPT